MYWVELRPAGYAARCTWGHRKAREHRAFSFLLFSAPYPASNILNVAWEAGLRSLVKQLDRYPGGRRA